MALGSEKLSATVKRKIRKQMNYFAVARFKVAACTYKSVAIRQAFDIAARIQAREDWCSMGRIHHPLGLRQKCGVVAVQLSESRE